MWSDRNECSTVGVAEASEASKATKAICTKVGAWCWYWSGCLGGYQSIIHWQLHHNAMSYLNLLITEVQLTGIVLLQTLQPWEWSREYQQYLGKFLPHSEVVHIERCCRAKSTWTNLWYVAGGCYYTNCKPAQKITVQYSKWREQYIKCHLRYMYCPLHYRYCNVEHAWERG